MSEDNTTAGAVRPDSLPEYNPLANYPLKDIVGRVINYEGASNSYLDPRGPVFFDVKPLPNVPLSTARYLAYKKEFDQFTTNSDGLGYSTFSQVRDERGHSVQPAGQNWDQRVNPKPTSFIME